MQADPFYINIFACTFHNKLYGYKHGQWTYDKGCVLKNIPNNLPIWTDGPNKFWGIWGISN